MCTQRIAALSFLIVASLILPAVATAQQPAFDRSFFADYSKLQKRTSPKGDEYVYIAPAAMEKLAKYNGVVVDLPEVLMSPQSDYKGAKPGDLYSIAELMRSSLSERLQAGGYNVVDAPGPGIIYVRLALTDLQLKKKKRGILGYTPIGAVVKLGTDAIKEMMSKYDIMNMAIQAELSDSQTREALGQIVAVRGGGTKPARIDFDELEAKMEDFGSRFRCRLDNARVPAAQQIDCLDEAARQAREAAPARAQ